MTRHVEGPGWSLELPQEVVGGEVAHSHTHLDTMAVYRGRAEDGSELEVIVTTYPGAPVGERGQPLDEEGEVWEVSGARRAVRRDQRTQLDDDPEVESVETIVVAATGETGSVVVAIHRPLDAPAEASEAVVTSLELSS